MVGSAFRDAFRMLRASPGLSAAAVFTLALGVGANAAIISVADAVLIEPLPYADEGRLIRVWEARAEAPAESGTVPANLEHYRAASSLAAVAGVTRRSFTLTGVGRPEQLRAEVVTPNFFQTLGVTPARGRAFNEAEEGARVAMLAYEVWRTRFAGDAAILGRAILLNDEPYEVIGVTPPSFQPLSRLRSGFTIELFVPASSDLLANSKGRSIDAVARLAPGVSIAQARAELDGISRHLASANPAMAGFTAYAAPIRDTIVRDERRPLVVLVCAAVLVLLVACVNVANLLLVRAIGRERDTAIRLALGATRRRVALELGLRGVLLGVIGGGAGLVAGLWTRDVLMAMVPVTFPLAGSIALNWRVLAAASALSIATGAAAGLVPALSTGRDLTVSLQRDGRTSAGNRRSARWRGLFMAAQVAAALVLAVGAGLLARSFAALTAIDLGFRSEGVLLMTLRPPQSRYPDAAARARLFERVERAIADVPGVETVGVASEFPMRGGSYTRFAVNGEVVRAGEQAVSAGYFTTLELRLRRGRAFAGDDRGGAPLVALVSESFARLFVGDAVGQRFTRQGETASITVIGVVDDMRRDGREARVRPQVYYPAAQTAAHELRVEEIAVRTRANPYSLLPAIEDAIWSVDRDQPVTNVQTLSGMVAEMAAGRRFNMTLMTAMAVVALVLAVVGVYGVTSHAAAQRTREIGIRTTLGAGRRQVIALVVGGSLKWVLAGLAAGLACSLGAARLMRSLLFGVVPHDTVTLFAVAAVMLIAVSIASYVPARRAASVDPIAALRSE